MKEYKQINREMGQVLKDFQISYNPSKTPSFTNFLDDKLSVVNTISGGVSFKFYEELKTLAPFTEEEWASYLGLSTKSLQRHRKEEGFKFKPIHSEKLIEFAEVIYKSYEVLENRTKVNAWLGSKAFSLGNLSPKELLKTSYGKDLLLAELSKIDHGLFA